MADDFHGFRTNVPHGQRPGRRFEFRYHHAGNHYAQTGAQNAYGARREIRIRGRLSELGLHVLGHERPISYQSHDEERVARGIEYQYFVRQNPFHRRFKILKRKTELIRYHACSFSRLLSSEL